MKDKPNKKIFGRLAPWKPIPLPTGPAFLQLPQPASPKALKPAPAPGDHHRETFEPIISRTIEMDKFTAEVILRYRDLDGEREIRTCPGDIYKIVNVFMDYARLLELVCDEWRSIAKKYQTAIGYDYDEAVAKCEAKKKRKPKDDDVGGDALELAMKRGKRSPKKKEK